MTIVQVAGVALSFRLDWSQNHLLNPLWHPHAKFHGALLLFMLAGVAATSLWSMWRVSREPDVAIRMAALLSLAFWTPLFYIHVRPAGLDVMGRRRQRRPAAHR